MSDPRVCIVGAGHHATRRIYPYVGVAGGQLVGVCDLDLDRAQRNARRFGGRAYADMDAMLDAEAPDAVMICIGPTAHAELAVKCLRRGLPVYTEKPPAPDAAAALEVARVSSETGCLCTTAFKKRYALAYERARAFIEEAGQGALLSLSVLHASGSYDNRTPRSDLLLDFGIHGIDLLAYLGGDVKRVFAFTADFHAYAASLEFACGAVATYSLNDGRSFQVPTEEVEITVAGGSHMTVHNSSQWRVTRGGEPAEWREPPTFVAGGDSGNDTGHLAEIVDFFAAVAEGRTTRSNIHESCKSLVLHDAIRRSAETGKVVEIAYAPPA